MQPTVGAPSTLERLISRDRFVVALGLAVITALSWVYLVRMAAGMNAAGLEADVHAAMGMPDMAAWGPAELLALFVMWAVMMAGMMLPSAAPLILLVVGTYRRRGAEARVMTALFTAGYLVVWTTFSAAAASVQFVLHAATLLSPAMATRSTLVAGGIFVAAGIYQWLPLKNACLTHCRSPLQFLTHEWREGPGGAFRMGARHGWFCVGCCWALMALLFAAGVMNLLWVAAIAAFVLIEKLLSRGVTFGRVASTMMIAWGAYLMVGALGPI